jgi:hypothetical protein
VRLRRFIGVGIGVLLVALTVAAVVLSAGPGRQVTRPYRSSHTFISTAADVCLEATARGTATATWSGSAPLVRWSDVRLSDPTMTAAAYGLTAGRCDHNRPISLAATMSQLWSGDGAAPVSRSTDVGPATSELRQFNSGTPVHLPDRGLPASLFASNYSIEGQILVDARLPNRSEGFGYRTRFTINAGPRS